MSYKIRNMNIIEADDSEIIRINEEFETILIESEDCERTFALLICMSCESHQNRVRHRLIIPDVDSALDAIDKASRVRRLRGEWATNIGVSLFKANQIFIVPDDWEGCDEQFK